MGIGARRGTTKWSVARRVAPTGAASSGAGAPVGGRLVPGWVSGPLHGGIALVVPPGRHRPGGRPVVRRTGSLWGGRGLATRPSDPRVVPPEGVRRAPLVGGVGPRAPGPGGRGQVLHGGGTGSPGRAPDLGRERRAPRDAPRRGGGGGRPAGAAGGRPSGPRVRGLKRVREGAGGRSAGGTGVGGFPDPHAAVAPTARARRTVVRGPRARVGPAAGGLSFRAIVWEGMISPVAEPSRFLSGRRVAVRPG